MHIGIDARMYGTHNRGIGRYTECLVLELAKLDDDNTYTLFVPREVASDLNLDKAKFNIVVTDVKWYGFREHITMPGLIKKSGVEMMHFTHLNVPYWCPVPYVVTIHDLIVFHFPDTRSTNLPKWKFKIKIWGYHKVLNNAVKKAVKIIAVSEFTKRDIVRHLNIDEKKITTTYLGVEKMILGTDIMRNTSQFDQMLAKCFNITKQYVLYVGSAYPHKNLESLINAFKIIREKYNRNWQLVLVGRIDEFYKKVQKHVEDSVVDKNIQKDIIFTGDVDDKNLDGIYRGAKVFAFPSLYEGFGLPPLEACSRGIPVVAAKSSSLPEVLTDCAHYCNPKDIEDIARAIDYVGGTHKVQDYLSARGRERAKHFSWQKLAKDTVDVYSRIMV